MSHRDTMQNTRAATSEADRFGGIVALSISLYSRPMAYQCFGRDHGWTGRSRSQARRREHTEAIVLRKKSFLAAVIWAVMPSTPAYAQDQPSQPSLGDVARQARKDKEKNKAQAKTVITDDTLDRKSVV